MTWFLMVLEMSSTGPTRTSASPKFSAHLISQQVKPMTHFETPKSSWARMFQILRSMSFQPPVSVLTV